MRKLVARSIAVALVAVLVSGCSSTGGQKSFGWASLNPMTYFASSDADSPVPKPSDQMAPTVTLPNASEVAESGGTAPRSPYGQAGLGDAVQTAATQASLGATGPQHGMYDPNGYAGTNVPLSPSSTGLDPYPAQSSAAGGYSTPPASGYGMPPAGQYALGGGSYDIQNQTQNGTSGLPAYANPTAPYANNAGPPASVPSYQLPPMSSQPSGYDAGLAQDPYGNATPPTYPGAASNGSFPGAGSSQPNVYADSLPANPGESTDLVASAPKLPPLPPQYTNSQPPYDPGNTGYNPTNVPSYTPPAPGGYVQPAAATQPSYAPGSTSRLPGSTGAATGGYGTAGSVF